MHIEEPAPVETAEGPASPGDHPHVPVEYQRGSGIKATLFALIVAAVLIVALIWGLRARDKSLDKLTNAVHDANNEPIAVDVVHVSRAAADSVLTLPGEAKSFFQTTLFARTSGYVSKWYVDIGDRVKTGQTLASIETPELDDQLREAQAKLQELKAEAHVAETSANFAKVSYDRWNGAAPEGVVSAQERDQKKAELDSAIAHLEAAQSQTALGDAEVARLQTLENFKKVAAPYDGTITQRHIDVGDLVTAGSTTNTSPMFTLSASDQIRVFVDVPQAATPDIHVGMDATVEGRQFHDRQFVGEVDRTANSLDPISRTLKVEVLVPNPEDLLKPGMYLQVNFKTARPTPPLKIPPAALAFGPHGPQVAIIPADHRVRFQDITIGRDLGDSIEVATGLTGNEAVALNIGSQITDGQQVDPHFIDTPTPPKPITSTALATPEK